MVVLILEKVKPSLRGLLTRWMIEPKTGVFVGTMSARVRDLLWDKVGEKLGPDGGAILIHPARNEQGFAVRSLGKTKRKIIDLEGLTLVLKPHKDPEAARKKMKLGREANQLLAQRRKQREEAAQKESARDPPEKPG